jgi:hypothetical protein
MGLGSMVIWALAVGYGILQAESAISITVLVYNYANTPGAKLEEAEAFAATSYRAAGIALTWVECTDSEDDIQRFRACEQASTGHPLVLRIIPERMASALPRFRESDDALGMATSSYAFVVYARTQKSAGVWGAPEHVVLGRTIAHELGHLLLGENSHSRNGLMQPRFGPQHLALESGQFLFNPKQAAHLRKLSRRSQ